MAKYIRESDFKEIVATIGAEAESGMICADKLQRLLSECEVVSIPKINNIDSVVESIEEMGDSRPPCLGFTKSEINEKAHISRVTLVKWEKMMNKLGYRSKSGFGDNMNIAELERFLKRIGRDQKG